MEKDLGEKIYIVPPINAFSPKIVYIRLSFKQGFMLQKMIQAYNQL